MIQTLVEEVSGTGPFGYNGYQTMTLKNSDNYFTNQETTKSKKIM